MFVTFPSSLELYSPGLKKYLTLQVPDSSAMSSHFCNWTQTCLYKWNADKWSSTVQGFFVFTRRHRCSLFRINSDAEASRIRAVKRIAGAWRKALLFTIIIDRSRTLLPNFELYCISNATPIGFSGADGLSWYRIVLSNVLGTSYRANEIKDNEDESKNGRGTHEVEKMKEKDGGRWFSSGAVHLQLHSY